MFGREHSTFLIVLINSDSVPNGEHGPTAQGRHTGVAFFHSRIPVNLPLWTVKGALDLLLSRFYLLQEYHVRLVFVEKFEKPLF